MQPRITPMKIIQYNEEYQAAILTLHKEALESIGAYAGEGPWDSDLHRIRQAYIDNAGSFLLGISNGELIAMGALKIIDAVCAEITRMRVKPSHQGRGHGTAILTRLLDAARDHGYMKVILETSTAQVPAQRLYRKHGFHETGRGVLKGFDVIFYELFLQH